MRRMLALAALVALAGCSEDPAKPKLEPNVVEVHSMVIGDYHITMFRNVGTAPATGVTIWLGGEFFVPLTPDSLGVGDMGYISPVAEVTIRDIYWD